MKKHILMFVALFAFGALFTACNEDEQSSPIEETVITSEDVATAQNLVQDIEDEVDAQVEFRDDPSTNADPCPTVTVDPEGGSFPRTVTIDYGPDGCEGPNGRVRRGQIIVTQTALLTEAGAERTVTFVDFFIDDAQVEGTKNWTNAGPDTDGHPTLIRTVDVTITLPTDQTISWSHNHTLTWIEGANTPGLWDNVLQVEGSSSGVNRFGTAYSVTITTPLIKRKNCPWIVSGVKEITVGDSSRTLDYGDGDCDRRATVTFPNGFSREILIRAWWRP